MPAPGAGRSLADSGLAFLIASRSDHLHTGLAGDAAIQVAQAACTSRHVGRRPAGRWSPQSQSITERSASRYSFRYKTSTHIIWSAMTSTMGQPPFWKQHRIAMLWPLFAHRPGLCVEGGAEVVAAMAAVHDPQSRYLSGELRFARFVEKGRKLGSQHGDGLDEHDKYGVFWHEQINTSGVL